MRMFKVTVPGEIVNDGDSTWSIIVRRWFGPNFGVFRAALSTSRILPFLRHVVKLRRRPPGPRNCLHWKKIFFWKWVKMEEREVCLYVSLCVCERREGVRLIQNWPMQTTDYQTKKDLRKAVATLHWTLVQPIVFKLQNPERVCFSCLYIVN